MKKQTQFLVAAGILALAASCNTGTASDPAAEAAKIDSMANARLEELKLELMARNDSTIMAMARERADSILLAMGNKPAATTAPKRVITRDKGTAKTDVPAKTSSESTQPTNTGKIGNQQNGENTGKKGSQETGVNTGKKGN